MEEATWTWWQEGEPFPRAADTGDGTKLGGPFNAVPRVLNFPSEA